MMRPLPAVVACENLPKFVGRLNDEVSTQVKFPRSPPSCRLRPKRMALPPARCATESSWALSGRCSWATQHVKKLIAKKERPPRGTAMIDACHGEGGARVLTRLLS